MKYEKRLKTRQKIGIILLLLLVVGIAAAFSSKMILKQIYPKKYESLVEKYSTEYGVPEELLFAIIKTESGFDAKARSDAGAIGLTQITSDTFSWLQSKTGDSLDFEELYNPETSIKYGALFISMLLSEFGDTDTAVAAYHAGRGQVNAWLSNPDVSLDGKTLNNIPISATEHYVFKINRAINYYNNLYK